MEVQEGEVRKYLALDVPENTRVFPMWLQKENLDDNLVTIDLSDFEEPEPNTLYSLCGSQFEVIEIIESHESKGEWNNFPFAPTWYKVLCRRVDYLHRYKEGLGDNEIYILK